MDRMDLAEGESGAVFERIAHTPAYERVAEAIEREILSGRLKPGTAIGTEADLVRQFGVNRSTVREGIRLLQQSGLVQRDSSRRLFASVPRYNKLASRISRALVLHQVTFRELWDVTISLEPLSAELACRHASDAQLAAIVENLAQQRLHLDKPKELSELDTEFHTMIGEASGNRILQLSKEPLIMLFQPTSQMLAEEVDIAPQRMIEAHTHVVDALLARDEATALLWMRRHITDYGRGFQRLGVSLDEPVESLYSGRAAARETIKTAG